MSTQFLYQLTDLFRSWLPDAGEGESDLRQLIDNLESAGTQRSVRAFAPPVVERWLADCCAQDCLPQHRLPQHRAMIDALLENCADLHWFAPQPEYAGAEMAQNYAVARLVGPQLFGEDTALYYNNKIAVGFTLQAPNIFYPSHWHPAVEFYGTLTGTGLWQIGDEPFEEKPPGAFIHHPTNIPHAMQTREQPMLTVYGWIGDIHTRPIVKNG